MNIPGLTEALSKLDTTAEQMEALNANLERVCVLLAEQNAILSSIDTNTGMFAG